MPDAVSAALFEAKFETKLQVGMVNKIFPIRPLDGDFLDNLWISRNAVTWTQLNDIRLHKGQLTVPLTPSDSTPDTVRPRRPCSNKCSSSLTHTKRNLPRNCRSVDRLIDIDTRTDKQIDAHMHSCTRRK